MKSRTGSSSQPHLSLYPWSWLRKNSYDPPIPDPESRTQCVCKLMFCHSCSNSSRKKNSMEFKNSKDSTDCAIRRCHVRGQRTFQMALERCMFSELVFSRSSSSLFKGSIWILLCLWRSTHSRSHGEPLEENRLHPANAMYVALFASGTYFLNMTSFCSRREILGLHF